MGCRTCARPESGWGQMASLNMDVSDMVGLFGMKGLYEVNILIMETVIQAAADFL
jgi:hypothetical protein